MVASVALRNEGPGRNIDTRADNYVFFFWGGAHFYLEQGMFKWSERLRVSLRTDCTVFEKKEKFTKFSRIFKYFDRLESLENTLSAVYSVRSR